MAVLGVGNQRSNQLNALSGQVRANAASSAARSSAARTEAYKSAVDLQETRYNDEKAAWEKQRDAVAQFLSGLSERDSNVGVDQPGFVGPPPPDISPVKASTDMLGDPDASAAAQGVTPSAVEAGTYKLFQDAGPEMAPLLYEALREIQDEEAKVRKSGIIQKMLNDKLAFTEFGPQSPFDQMIRPFAEELLKNASTMEPDEVINTWRQFRAEANQRVARWEFADAWTQQEESVYQSKLANEPEAREILRATQENLRDGVPRDKAIAPWLLYTQGAGAVREAYGQASQKAANDLRSDGEGYADKIMGNDLTLDFLRQQEKYKGWSDLEIRSDLTIQYMIERKRLDEEAQKLAGVRQQQATAAQPEDYRAKLGQKDPGSAPSTVGGGGMASGSGSTPGQVGEPPPGGKPRPAPAGPGAAPGAPTDFTPEETERANKAIGASEGPGVVDAARRVPSDVGQDLARGASLLDSVPTPEGVDEEKWKGAIRKVEGAGAKLGKAQQVVDNLYRTPPEQLNGLLDKILKLPKSVLLFFLGEDEEMPVHEKDGVAPYGESPWEKPKGERRQEGETGPGAPPRQQTFRERVGGVMSQRRTSENLEAAIRGQKTPMKKKKKK